MKNLKNILILIFPIFTFSQNHFLDFAINKKNDTIYGTIRNVEFGKCVFLEKNLNSQKKGIKFYSHNLNKFKTIRFNDEIYSYQKPNFDDGIYQEVKPVTKDSIEKRIGDFVSVNPKLKDFILTKEGDTIYGKIENPFVGKLHFYDSTSTKFQIDRDRVERYRFNNELFVLKEKPMTELLNESKSYSKLIIDGKVKLYQYVIPDFNLKRTFYKSSFIYFIEKDGAITIINNLLYKKKLAELFSNNKNLVDKILNDEYTLDNIYLIVKYYNSTL